VDAIIERLQFIREAPAVARWRSPTCACSTASAGLRVTSGAIARSRVRAICWSGHRP